MFNAIRRPNEYLKERIVHHYQILLGKGVNYGIYGKVANLLKHECLLTNRFFVRRTIRTFNSCGKLYRDTGKGRPNRLSSNVNIRNIIDKCLRDNDETNTKSIRLELLAKGFSVSVSTINKIKRSLGWTLRGTRYCQLIREANKPKRLQWAKDNINDRFDDVIWTDETSVWLEQHATKCYRKKGVLPKRKPKPKYPLKVHVWAGISKNGRTDVCIFKGIMDASLYIKILEETLLPFIHNKYPNGHRFMQDNDPKHNSVAARRFLENNNVNWWKTPPESPDLNPIENLWHEMKDYIRREVKPRNENDLINGIMTFWNTVSVEKCKAYISHLRKVIPEVIKQNGNATRY